MWVVIGPKVAKEKKGNKVTKFVGAWREWVRRDVEGSKKYIGESEYKALKMYLKPLIN